MYSEAGNEPAGGRAGCWAGRRTGKLMIPNSPRRGARALHSQRKWLGRPPTSPCSVRCHRRRTPKVRRGCTVGPYWSEQVQAAPVGTGRHGFRSRLCIGRCRRPRRGGLHTCRSVARRQGRRDGPARVLRGRAACLFLVRPRSRLLSSERLAAAMHSAPHQRRRH